MSYELSARLVMLQRGRARAGAEIAPLLLLVAQARNTWIARACVVLSVCMLAMSGCIVIIGSF
jgi:hypothetical protein